MIPSKTPYEFNENRAKIIRKNTENMMFEHLRIKVPTEQLVCRYTKAANDFCELPGFIISHESGKSHILILERSKINYMLKFVFEAFFPHSNDFLIKKLLYTGLILDTKKHYKIDIEVFQSLVLARDITLIQNEEEMHQMYDFFFTNDSALIQEADQSFSVYRDKDIFLPDEPNEIDFEYSDKLHHNISYDVKPQPRPGTKIFPTITNDNYNFIKRDFIEKKLFRKFKLKRPKEKLVVNTNVITGKIINYPGFDIIHGYRKTLLLPNDKDLINYTFKFIYEMFCPRETPNINNVYLYKALKIHDINFWDVTEDDFEVIYPFIKVASYIVLIHNERHNVLNYLFTFGDDAKAKSEDPKYLNPLFLKDEDDDDREDIESIEKEYENLNLFDMSLYEHPKLSEENEQETEENKEKINKDHIPKVLMSSKFKLQALQSEKEDKWEAEDDSDDSDDDSDDDEEDYEGKPDYRVIDPKEEIIRKTERRFIKKQQKYLQDIESLLLKHVREKGPVGVIEEESDNLAELYDSHITQAPVDRLYRTLLGPGLRELGPEHIIYEASTFPVYGDSDRLGFTLRHYLGYTSVDINPGLKNKTYLLKFLCYVLILKEIPKSAYEKTPYDYVSIDGKDYKEFTEEFLRAILDAKEIKLIWRGDTFPPAYHL